MNNFVIETKQLTKVYGEQDVVKAVNIHVKKGRIYGLLGRNGAGKTTIMKMILGLTPITSGKVDVFGQDIKGREKQVFPRIGAIIETPGFYPNLTGTENLEIFAKLRGTVGPNAVKKALEVVGLPYKDKKLFSKYSLGMKQRLGIANAILHDPELLILDEPTNGLDPIGIAEMRNFIKELSVERGKTILISSHILSEIALLASREERELLKLIQTEFLKLHRRKFVWLMLLSAFFMPFLALFYFQHIGKIGIVPVQFYKWTAFSYTPWIILPVVLGILCTMLMYDENQHDMLKQLWIVPVSRMEYFFGKFVIVLSYSILFMLITVLASIAAGVLTGYIVFEWDSTLYLLKKCIEIGGLTAFAILPILAVAASSKGYILPVCVTLVYTFLGFILLMINMYLHPLSSMNVIVMRDIPGVVFNQELNLPAAFLCIGLWAIASSVFANLALARRK